MQWEGNCNAQHRNRRESHCLMSINPWVQPKAKWLSSDQACRVGLEKPDLFSVFHFLFSVFWRPASRSDDQAPAELDLKSLKSRLQKLHCAGSQSCRPTKSQIRPTHTFLRSINLRISQKFYVFRFYFWTNRNNICLQILLPHWQLFSLCLFVNTFPQSIAAELYSCIHNCRRA